MKAFRRMIIAGTGLALAGCTSLPGANLGDTFLVEGFLNEATWPTLGGSLHGRAGESVSGCRRRRGEERCELRMTATAFYRKGQAAAAGEEVGAVGSGDLSHLTGAPVLAYQQMLLGSGRQQRHHVRKPARAWSPARLLAGAAERRRSLVCTDPGVVQAQYAEAFAEVVARATSAAKASVGSCTSALNVTILTAEARGVIDEVVSAVQGYTSPMLSIVGHTDTVGSKAYNQGLSERRANTVYRALEAKGVPGSAMTKCWPLGARAGCPDRRRRERAAQPLAS